MRVATAGGMERFILADFFFHKFDNIITRAQYGLLSYVNLITFYEHFLNSHVYVVNRIVNNSMSTNMQGLVTRIYLSIYRLLYRSKIQLR